MIRRRPARLWPIRIFACYEEACLYAKDTRETRGTSDTTP